MKKTLYFAALAALFLASCSKATAPQEGNPSQGLKEVKISVEAASVSDTLTTKSVWKDGEGLQWSSSDASLLGLAASSENLPSKSIDFPEGKANFTVDVPEGATEGLAYYPYSASAASFNDAGVPTLSFSIASSQTQAAAGETQYSEGNVAMTGSSVLDLSQSALSASMEIHTAFVRFLIYSTAGKTEKVSSVKIAANAPLAGKMSVTCSSSKTVSTSETSNEVTVSLTEAFDLSGIKSFEATKGIYCGVFPCESNGITYSVTTDEGIYTFTSTKKNTFTASEIRNVKLNLDNATAFTPYPSILYMGIAATASGLNSEEKTAYEWLKSEYGADADYVSVSQVNSGYDLSHCKVLWSHLHIDGGVDYTEGETTYYNTGAIEKRYPEVKTAIEQKINPLYFNSGLSLLCTRYATIYPGFLGFAVPNNCWGGNEASPETADGQWTITAASAHDLYSTLATEFPSSIVTNNAADYGYTNSTAQFHIGSDWGGYADDAAWTSATKGTILGKGGDGSISVWEFIPEYEVRGKILCIGSGCYDWSYEKNGAVIANDCAHVKTLTKNAIEYLKK